MTKNLYAPFININSKTPEIIKFAVIIFFKYLLTMLHKNPIKSVEKPLSSNPEKQMRKDDVKNQSQELINLSKVNRYNYISLKNSKKDKIHKYEREFNNLTNKIHTLENEIKKQETKIKSSKQENSVNYHIKLGLDHEKKECLDKDLRDITTIQKESHLLENMIIRKNKMISDL